jgi:hypothetical protein
MSDYVVPRFLSRQKAGEKFFNNMFKEEVTIASTGFGFSATSIPVSCSTTGSHSNYTMSEPLIAKGIPLHLPDSKGNSLPVMSYAVSDDEILRIQKLVSTETWAKRGASDSDIWESLAEYNQVMELVNVRLGSLKDLSSRLLNSATRSVFSRDITKSVSGGYLMYRYGILPLMSDIRNLLSSLSKASGKKEVTVRAYSELKASKTVPGTFDHGILRVTYDNVIDDFVTVRGMSLDEGFVSLANNLGLSSKGLMMLPWQLTGYSFVADWFANLGSYIQSTLPTLGWKQLGSCLVTTRVTSNLNKVTGSTNLSPTQFNIDSAPTGFVQIVKRSVTRGPLLSASVVLESDFKFDSFTRAADAAALLASRFVKIHTRLSPTPNNSAFRDKKAYHHWANTPGVL